MSAKPISQCMWIQKEYTQDEQFTICQYWSPSVPSCMLILSLSPLSSLSVCLCLHLCYVCMSLTLTLLSLSLLSLSHLYLLSLSLSPLSLSEVFSDDRHVRTVCVTWLPVCARRSPGQGRSDEWPCKWKQDPSLLSYLLFYSKVGADISIGRPSPWARRFPRSFTLSAPFPSFVSLILPPWARHFPHSSSVSAPFPSSFHLERAISLVRFPHYSFTLSAPFPSKPGFEVPSWTSRKRRITTMLPKK